MDEPRTWSRSLTGAVSRVWEASLLRPAVVIVRVLLTLTLIGAEIALFIGMIEVAEDHPIAMVPFLLLMAAALIPYFILMVVPDLWQILLSWEAHTSVKSGPRLSHGRYRGLILGSDFLRLAAVVVVAASLLLLVGAAVPDLFSSRIHSWPGWWKVLVAIGGLAMTGYATYRFFSDARSDGTDSSLSRWTVTLIVGLVFFQLAVANRPGMSPVAVVVFFAVAVAAAMRAWRAWQDGDQTTTGVAGVIAIFTAVPALLEVGDLRALPSGVFAFLLPWWESMVEFALIQLKTVGLGVAYRGNRMGDMAIVLAIAGFIAFTLWLRSDVLRCLMRVGEGLTVGQAGRVRRMHLLVLRWLALAAMVFGGLVSLFGSNAEFYLGEIMPREISSVFVQSGGTLLAMLGFGFGALATADVFQAAADAERATRGSGSGKTLDFKWLKALIALIYIALGVLAVVGVGGWVAALVEYEGRMFLLTLPFVLIAAVVWLILFATPHLITNMIRIEGNTRPDEAKRVSVAVGYPGVSAFLVWGRVVNFFAVLAILVLTIGSVVVSDAFSRGRGGGEEELAIIVGGIVSAVVVSIVLGSGPDFLSLLLSLERNFKEGSFGVVGDAAVPAAEADADDADLSSQFRQAVAAVGDQCLSDPVVLPAGPAVLTSRGRRGAYELHEDTQGHVLIGPGGESLGILIGDTFLPEDGTPGIDEPTAEELAAIDEIYRTPGVPLDHLKQAPVTRRMVSKETVAVEVPMDGPTPATVKVPVTDEGDPTPSTVKVPVSDSTPPTVKVPVTDVGDPTPPTVKVLISDPTPPTEIVTVRGELPAPEPDLLPTPPADDADRAAIAPPPLVDVERTPRVGEGAETGEASTPGPEPLVETGRESREVFHLQMDTSQPGGRVQAALIELLLLKDAAKRLPWGSVSSRLDGEGLHIEIAGLEPSLATWLEGQLNAEAARTVSFATGLVTSNVVELKRFASGEVDFARGDGCKLAAPGWVAGALPPLTGDLQHSGSGKTAYRGPRGRRYHMCFVVRQESEFVVYGVRV